MDTKTAFKNQYHAAMAMLKPAIEECPEDLWLAGESPRTYWRIAYHALYYTHLYLHQTAEDFVPWTKGRDNCASLWSKPSKANSVPYTKEEILEYWNLLEGFIDGAVDTLDFDAEKAGFSYYPNQNKLDHQFINLRHIQHHVGQLSELLLNQGIDITWIGGKRS